MTTERWDAISKGSEPFQYETEGFTVKMGTGITKLKWKEIKQVVAYRVEYFSHDEIGLDVYAENGIEFSVPELTPGSLMFYSKMKENLKLTDEWWMGSITTGESRKIIYSG